MGTKDRIVLESLKMFNENGLHQVGVREIAQKLKLSPGNLSYHFPKKETLVLHLMTEFRDKNTKAFDEYRLVVKPTLFEFMQLIKQLHLNAYEYRGVTQDFAEVSRILVGENVRIENTEAERKSIYTDFFLALVQNRELKLRDGDMEFLNSFMSFFLRFWVIEAFVSYRHKSKAEIVGYYLAFDVRQFSLFATAKGQKSLERFKVMELESKMAD